jgi:hypothetical protein
MVLYDHIQELRAELSACKDAGERRQIRSELAEAMAQQRVLDVAFEILLVAA